MFFIKDIPHLKLFRTKVILPIDEKIQTMNSIVFVNNNSIDSTIDLMNNKYIYHNNKYHYYYLDFMYRGKIHTKPYIINMRKDREALYEKIESNMRFIRTKLSFESIGNKNVYFDLFKYNEIFFKYGQKLLYIKKVKTYIDFLKGIIDDTRFDAYKNKTIMIGVEEWSKNDLTGIKKLKPKFDNPIFIIYYTMFKFFDVFKTLGDINIVFYNNNLTLRLNPSLCDEKSFQIFRRELLKLSSRIEIPEEIEEVEKDIKKYDVVNDVVSNMKETYKLTGNSIDETEFIDDELDYKFDENVIDRVDEIVNDNKEEYEKLSQKELRQKLQNELINDTEFSKKVYDINQTNLTGRTTESLKRDEELRKKQKELKIDNMTIDEIKTLNDRLVPIPVVNIENKVNTTNKNVTTIRYPHFEKTYNEKFLKRDLVNTLTFLNEKSLPVYIRDIKHEDTSDELNLKETYTVDLEDVNRVRHKLKFDMPLFIDDRFMYLNGNKKIIIKQEMMKPVSKTGPDVVQICGNYKKIFIWRYGNKVSTKMEKLKKLFNEPKKGVNVKYGNNLSVNNKYKSIFEYDELSTHFSTITISNCIFMFNQDEVQEKLKENKIKLKDNEFCVGFFLSPKNSPIIMDINSQRMAGGGTDLIDFILSVGTGELVQEFDEISAGKKFMYSRAKIMSRFVPLILFLGYLEGLSTVMRKANIKYTFHDKRPHVDINNQGIIQFADGYLVFDKYPFENSLLMNAFSDIPTKTFNFEEFDSKDVYLTIFDIMFNNKIIGNAFDNFYEFMIDPITKEVLEDLNYPTDFVSLIIFANSLLADNSYIKENDMNLYRVRSNELVNGFLYQAISDAYIRYKLTANNNNPEKISVKPDIVLKKILTAQTVEDYSTLNPIVELEKSRAITPKGLSGMNVDEAYTQDKRSYDKSMLGIMAMSTSPDA